MNETSRPDGPQGKSFRELVEYYNRELLRYNREHGVSVPGDSSSEAENPGDSACGDLSPDPSSADPSPDGAPLPQEPAPADSSAPQIELLLPDREGPAPVPPRTELIAPLPPERETPDPSSVGYLRVQVVTARQAFPVEGAYVSITRPDGAGEALERLLYTGRDGNTALVALPAADPRLSQRPGVKNPFTYYNVRVDYPGFFSVKSSNVVLFGGITSIQPVELVPLPEHYQGDGLTEYGGPEPQSL